MTVDSVRKSRLEEPEKKPAIEPFFRAKTLDSLSLYWVGISAWPPTFRDREWLLAFTDLLVKAAGERMGTEPMQFLEMATTGGPIRDLFLKTSLDTMPVMGAVARPSRAPALPPNEEEMKSAQEQKTPPPSDQYAQDYIYWMLKANDYDQRQWFQGYGGMTLLLAEPDEKARIKVPEVRKDIREHPAMREMFEKIDLKKQVRVLEMMRSEFGQKSKTLFGRAFVEQPHYRGIPFVVPLWQAADFLNATEVQLEEMFAVTKIYMRESPEDKGILIACRENLDALLDELVGNLRERNLSFG